MKAFKLLLLLSVFGIGFMSCQSPLSKKSSNTEENTVNYRLHNTMN